MTRRLPRSKINRKRTLRYVFSHLRDNEATETPIGDGDNRDSLEVNNLLEEVDLNDSEVDVFGRPRSSIIRPQLLHMNCSTFDEGD